ncbi:MAG: hypothetical protein ACP5O6_07250 [Candidatus Baltobacteraceae bacterium]
MVGNLFAAAAIGALANGGPCTAARVIAGSAIYRGRNRRIALSAFTFGAFATDVALVSSLGLFFRALQFTGWLYALAAIAALFGALRSLFRPTMHTCLCASESPGSGKYSILTYPMLVGIASALMLGACCAPFVFAAAATVGQGAGPLAVAVVYGVARACVPLAATMLGNRLMPARLPVAWREAALTVQSGLLLGCAIYFGMLA